MDKIEVIDFSKTIKGVLILDNINVSFEKGKIYGLHGSNGCGKTMLLRAICGLIRPTNGFVKYDEKVLHKDIDFPESIGVLIENPEFWKGYTGKEVLLTLASYKKIANEDAIDNVLKRVGLDPKDKRTIKKYSLGMKQRLGIAQALMEKPEVILLDEPTNAIDKKGVKQVRELIINEKKRGAIVIIASHSQEDIDDMCDVIIEMGEGKIEEITDNNVDNEVYNE